MPPTDKKRELKDNESDPEFNQAIAYHESIRKLLNKAHDMMISNNYIETYEYLMQVKIEVYPRKPITYKENVLDVEKKCESIYVTWNGGERYQALNFQKALHEWFLQLSIYLHDCKLMMPDKADESEATEI